VSQWIDGQGIAILPIGWRDTGQYGFDIGVGFEMIEYNFCYTVHNCWDGGG